MGIRKLSLVPAGLRTLVAAAAFAALLMWSTDLPNVHVTPTLLLVDSQGHVNAMWQGALTPEQEQAVMARLF